MNQIMIGWSIILVLTLSACGAEAVPTVNVADVQNTAVAEAFTLVAQTEAAIPSATPLPPTATLTQIPLPTNTPLPSLTPSSLSTSPAGTTPQANIPTFTPQTSGSGQDPCNQPLTSWEGPSANLNIVNETRPEGTIILSLYVVTDLGQCGYLYVTGNGITGPIGQYSAGAFVTGKQNLKVFGGFRITPGNWKIVVRNENIVALGGCYPNC